MKGGPRVPDQTPDGWDYVAKDHKGGFTRLTSHVPTMSKALGRQIWVRRKIHLVVLGVIVGLTAYHVFTFFYTPSVPGPTTQVSSISAPGETAMYGLFPTRTAAARKGPKLKGTVLWKFETVSESLASPAVVNGVIYLPTGERRALALRSEDGTLLWEQPISGTVNFSPAVSDGLVYYGLRDAKMVALDAKTGHLAWEYLTDGPIFTAPVVHQGVVYIGTVSGTLFALDAKTGEPLWSFELEQAIYSPVAVNEEVLAVATQWGKTYILDQKTGQKLLLFDLGRIIQTSPVFQNHRLFLTSRQGAVAAVDWRQREYPLERMARYWRLQFWWWGLQDRPPVPKGLLWAHWLGRGSFVSSPAVLENALYASASNGTLVALDVMTGEKLWDYSRAGQTLADPIVAGDTVYVGDNDGVIHAVNRKTGEGLWTLATQGAITTRPVIAGDTMYVASRGGSLYAIR